MDFIESKVGTTEDESPPVYVNNAEIGIEDNTSLEIRGPPASTGECSTIYSLSTYVTSDGFLESSDVEGTA